MRLAVSMLLAASTTGIGTALAEPDPVAQRAGEEANLVTEERRQGFWMQGTIGGSITVGGGTGSGGQVSLKLGHVMRPTWVGFVELTINGQGHEVEDKLEINNHATLGPGLQWWPGKSALYIRAAAGYGTYACKKCRDPDDEMNIVPVDYMRRGLASSVGFGIEVARLRRVSLGIEPVSVAATITRDGAIVSLGILNVFLSLN